MYNLYTFYLQRFAKKQIYVLDLKCRRYIFPIQIGRIVEQIQYAKCKQCT